MKKISIVLGLSLVFAPLGAQPGESPGESPVFPGGTMFVATRTLLLKSHTWFFAASMGTLEYGDSVTVLQLSGSWAEIQSDESPSLSGWVRLSSLSATASGGGEGWGSNFAYVDRIEEISINEAELFRFLEDGRLSVGSDP